MPDIARKFHVKDGKKIYIRIGESPPIIREGKINEGAFFIVVGDDLGEKRIRLSDQEALDIAYRIITMYQMHIRIYRKLDRQSYQEYKQRMEIRNEGKEVETEIIRFVINAGGETTIDEIKRTLGSKYADYLETLEKKGLIILKENKVLLNISK
ncbi:hypothetical protein DDW12_05305 [Sulfolobus islandicus]|nr:hypothetical protein DDW12_05305 [Sulfolobus islandicus]